MAIFKYQIDDQVVKIEASNKDEADELLNDELFRVNNNIDVLKASLTKSTASQEAPDPSSVPDQTPSDFLKETAETTLRNAPEIGGAMIGGALGGIPGAALGGAAGSAFKQLGQRAIGSDEAPKTSGEAATDIAVSGAIGGIAEGAGKLIVSGAAKAFAPFKSKVIPVVNEIKNSFAKVGGRFTPAQATETMVLDIAENMAEGSFTGSGTMRAFKLAQEESLRKLSRNVASKFATESTRRLSDREVGDLFLNVAKGGRAAHSAIAGRLYSQVDDLAKGISVRLGSAKDPVIGATSKKIGVKELSTQISGELQKLKGLGSTSEVQRILNSVGKLDDQISFADAHKLRSTILTKIRDIKNVPGEGQAVRVLARLAENIDDTMNVASNNLKGGANRIWRKANSFFKMGKNTFDNDFMAKLIIENKKAPERIGETIFRAGNVDEVMKAKRALRLASRLDRSINFDESWRAMQSGFYENLLARSQNVETGAFIGNKMLKEFIDPKRKRTLEAIFSPEQLSSIKDFAKTASIVQSRPPGNAGMVMQLAQGGAVIGLASGNLEDESTAILIGPFALAHLLTNPRTARWLTEGLRLPFQAGSRRVISLISNIAGQVAKENLRDVNSGEK